MKRPTKTAHSATAAGHPRPPASAIAATDDEIATAPVNSARMSRLFFERSSTACCRARGAATANG